MKNLLSVLLALAMVLALAACAAKAPAQDPPAASAAAETPSAGKTPDAPAAENEPETATPEETASGQTAAELPDAEISDAGPEPAGGRTLIAYFSCTGTTRAAAEQLAALTGADLYEIVPEEAYTADDLDYNSDCRANREQNDPSARPAIAGELPDLTDYDTILLGYPIWWGTLPKIIDTFIESRDCSGKVILPFCTSGGSGIGTSVSALRDALPDADVRDGLRMNGAAEEEMQTWLTENGAALLGSEE